MDIQIIFESLCTSRELNPGIQLGRLTCYLYITGAEEVMKSSRVTLDAGDCQTSGFKRRLPVGLAFVITEAES